MLIHHCHPCCFMAHDLHDRLEVCPCHSQPRSARMPQIMESESDLLLRLGIDPNEASFLDSIPESIG